MLPAWPAYLAYVVSFLTIGAAWLLHTALTGRLARSDPIFRQINLLILLVVAFLPFPARLAADTLHNDGAERVAVTVVCWSSRPSWCGRQKIARSRYRGCTGSRGAGVDRSPSSVAVRPDVLRDGTSLRGGLHPAADPHRRLVLHGDRLLDSRFRGHHPEIRDSPHSAHRPDAWRPRSPGLWHTSASAGRAARPADRIQAAALARPVRDGRPATSRTATSCTADTGSSPDRESRIGTGLPGVTAAGPARSLLPALPNRSLVHRAAAGDQVDHHADQRDEQDEQEPQGLGPAGQVRAAVMPGPGSRRVWSSRTETGTQPGGRACRRAPGRQRVTRRR